MQTLDELRQMIGQTSEGAIDVTSIGPDTLFAEMGLTSLDRISIVIAIEERYKIEVTEEQFDQTSTVGDLLALIASKEG